MSGCCGYASRLVYLPRGETHAIVIILKLRLQDFCTSRRAVRQAMLRRQAGERRVASMAVGP